MKIALEGMDGAGKSTVARELARRLGAQYADGRLNNFFLEQGMSPEDLAIIKRALDLCADDENSLLRTWIYGYAGLFNLSHYKADVVIDRYHLTTYYYNGDAASVKLYKIMQEISGKPDLVIILRASVETRTARLRNRNPSDPDLRSKMKICDGYDKFEEAAKILELNYRVVDTDGKNLAQVIEEVMEIITEGGYGTVLADDGKM